MATIVLFRNPLAPHTRELIQIEAGTRVIDWLQANHPTGFGVPIRFFVNDVEKPLDDLDHVIGANEVVVISLRGPRPPDGNPLIATELARADIGDPLTADLAEIEQACIRILDAASVPYDIEVLLAEPQIGEKRSREDYALRILSRLHLLRKFIGTGNARIAADYALELGYLLNEARLGPLALKAASSAWGRTKSKNKRQRGNASRNATIRKDYEVMMSDGNPRKAVLADLCKKFGLSVRTLCTIIPRARGK